MKYIDEFRQHDLAGKLAADIAREAEHARQYRLMEFCGGHTHAIFRYGVQDLLPENVRFIHGPGCPVCVLPTQRLDQAIDLAERPEVILCTYADMLRVPASGRRSLLKVKAAGADVRHGVFHTGRPENRPGQPAAGSGFFAIGFETTTPPTAVALLQASQEDLQNFSVFCNHVLTPVAMRAILEAPEPVAIDGFLGPSHVSTIIGSRPYEQFVEQYRKPVVIAGFEPLDVMQSALMLIRLLNDNRQEVENEYTRAVTREGNAKAQALVAEVFQLRSVFAWRGLGDVAESALQIRPAFARFDAERRFSLPHREAADVKGCECPAVLRGAKQPVDCKLFGTVCTPENPMGSCMVSSEGACAAYWSYGRLRQPVSGRRRKSAVIA